MPRRAGDSVGIGAMRVERFVFVVVFGFLCCSSSSRFADAYDPMDPNGNITINWDFLSLDVKDANTYTVMVSIHNNQLYRHIERPGWRLSWTWAGKEVIWAATGAEATEQGDCSRVGGGGARPHCCQRRPVMADLPPGTPYNQQVSNCCRGGVLSSLVQSNATSAAAFQMVVGGYAAAAAAAGGKEGPEMPWGFDVGVPGYSCSNATTVPPTRSKVDSQRHVQVPLTWQVTCSYSQYRVSASPSCCVSLSTFYNEEIVSCPRCTCGCRGSPTSPKCISGGELGTLALPSGGGEPVAPIVRCSEHMCPIRVHWHVKVNYRKYWRVKVTVSNYNLVSNLSDWNLVLQHPNLRSLVQLFSFNYKPLVEYGTFNDTGMFWGIRFYNEMLLQDGNVQTEMILKKEEGEFTYSGGWAFPRRVYFDGHECVMPPADQYPMLPNEASATRPARRRSLLAGGCLLLLSFLVLV